MTASSNFRDEGPTPSYELMVTIMFRNLQDFPCLVNSSYFRVFSRMTNLAVQTPSVHGDGAEGGDLYLAGLLPSVFILVARYELRRQNIPTTDFMRMFEAQRPRG